MGQRVAKRPPQPVTVVAQPYNQFITVDDMVRAKRKPNTTVSVEGYLVVGIRRPDGTVRAWLVDSVDKVLCAKEADALTRTGASLTVPAATLKRAPCAWNRKGLQRFVMYTGKTKAQVCLNDTMPKVRVTGPVAVGRAALGPVSRIEYMDINGDWKAL